MSNRDDLEALVAELNTSGSASAAPANGASCAAPDTPAADVQLARLGAWLDQVVRHGGSDLLLVAGAPPSMRINGSVAPLAGGPLDGEAIEDVVLPALPPHAQRQYRATGIADGSFRWSGTDLAPGGGGPAPRFRINLHHQRGHAAAAL